jgi:hypothetical protein
VARSLGSLEVRRRIAVAAAALLAPLSPAAAQYKVLGPTSCVSCHDHERQALKWQKEEPANLGVKAHFNTRKQLDAPKAAAYAKAIGLADPYDLKGSCVQCHATVFKGDANAGVSCESCHGAASGYNEPHQAKGSYAKAVSLGLRDLRGQPAAIAKTCVECHVTADKRLGDAGHPKGDAFDAGVSLQKIVHWAATYDYAAIGAAGKKLTAAKLGGAAGPGPKPPAATAAPPPPGASAKPPAGGPPATTAAATPAPAKPPKGAAAAPTAEPAPWDWDQPVRALPADYVPDSGGGDAATPAPTADKPTPAPKRGRSRVPLSIAYESPLPPAVPGSTEPAPLTAAVAPAASVPATPAPSGSGLTASASVAPPPASAPDASGRILSLLERALRAGTRGPGLSPPARPREYPGPDGELLRVQDEAMALALEALRRPE